MFQRASGIGSQAQSGQRVRVNPDLLRTHGNALNLTESQPIITLPRHDLFLRTCKIGHMVKKIPTKTLRSGSAGDNALWGHIDALRRANRELRWNCLQVGVFVLRADFAEVNRQHKAGQNPTVWFLIHETTNET